MGSDSNGSARARWWERWAPASGAVAVILMAIAFLVAGSSPDPGDPATEIASYLASDSNQNQNFAAFFVFLAGVLFMLVFFSVLRSRLSGGRRPRRGPGPPGLRVRGGQRGPLDRCRLILRRPAGRCR